MVLKTRTGKVKMQNKISYTGKKLLIALALTVMVFGPISSEAFTVIYSGNNATTIEDLQVFCPIPNSDPVAWISRWYDVDFLWGKGPETCNGDGLFPDFDFRFPFYATTGGFAANAALSSIPTVETVVRPETYFGFYIPLPFSQGATPDVIALSGFFDDASSGWKSQSPIQIPWFGQKNSYAVFRKVPSEPIPAAVWLLGGGLIGLLGIRRKKYFKHVNQLALFSFIIGTLR